MESLSTQTLLLEPLTKAHAAVMFELLSDERIYRYLDSKPPASIDHLRSVYSQLETRQSPDLSQVWLNWIVRKRPGEEAIGYVQATLIDSATAWVAYVLGPAEWGQGHARVAVGAMIEHLHAAWGIERYLATIEAENERSARLLECLGFHKADGSELLPHDLSPTEVLYVSSKGF